MAKSYGEKLKDPRWQKMRLKILERDSFTCQLCGSEDKTLHVHHGYYEKSQDPWNYPPSTLWTVCEECHLEVADYLQAIHCDLAHVPPTHLDLVMSLTRALRDHYEI